MHLTIAKALLADAETLLFPPLKHVNWAMIDVSALNRLLAAPLAAFFTYAMEENKL